MMNANSFQQRQVLGGAIGGVVSQVGEGISSAIGGAVGGAVSQVGDGISSAIGGAVGGVLTPILPPPTSTPTTTRSSTSTTPTVLTTSPSVGRSSTSSPPSSSPSSVPLSTSISETTSDGVQHTVTAFVTDTAATTSSAPPPLHTNKSFLQNKSLSGFVFALSGIVGLALIILIVTFALKRRRRKKLENEAISYDPSVGYHDDMETCLVSEETSSEHPGRAYGTTCAPNPNAMSYQGRAPAYSFGTNYNIGVGAPPPPQTPNPAYDPGRYSSELYRSTSRGSGHSVSPPPPPAKVPTSLLNGGALKNPAAVRPPTPPQLPLVFGDIDESPIDLKVANQ